MTLQTLPNYRGLFMSTTSYGAYTGVGTVVLDATNENRFWVGRILLSTGPGTSKTISAAGGGQIMLYPRGTITMANAGTTWRLGIQDLDSAGLPDGTFDVYKDLVGGTDTLTANTTNKKTMGSGTKTIAHGDIVAIGVNTQSRAGADTIGIGTYSASGIIVSQAFPYGVTNGAPTTSMPAFGIIFDDGTLGYMEEMPLAWDFGGLDTITFNSGSTPDEYASCFQIPFKGALSSFSLYIGSIASTDTMEMILYSDPFGTPTAIETLTIDPNLTGGAAGLLWATLSTYRTLNPNTWYAVALRPTSANSLTWNYYNMASGNEVWKKAYPFGTNLKMAGRTNQSGAFSETQTYHMPIMNLNFVQLDDGAGGGGGSSGFFIQ